MTDPIDGVADAVVKEATGGPWPAWLELLAERDGVDLDLRGHVAGLAGAGLDRGWWRQPVAVGTEQVCGWHPVAETADAGDRVVVERTVAADRPAVRGCSLSPGELAHRLDDVDGSDPGCGVIRTAEDDTTGEDHLDRSRDVWDRRSRSYDRDERELAGHRETAIDHLAPRLGDRVLEVGCGPGTNFERLVAEIGETGTLVGVDYSPEMLARARDRVRDHGWTNVDLVEADATTGELGGPYDRAIAILALSVMPDPHRAVANVYSSLAPGGTLVVFDVRTVPSGPVRVLNPLLRRFFRWYANWNPDGDVPRAVGAVFDDHDVVETSFAGIGYTMVAHKDD